MMHVFRFTKRMNAMNDVYLMNVAANFYKFHFLIIISLSFWFSYYYQLLLTLFFNIVCYRIKEKNMRKNMEKKFSIKYELGMK